MAKNSELMRGAPLKGYGPTKTAREGRFTSSETCAGFFNVDPPPLVFHI